MANSIAVSRAQLIYALCLPLAVFVGYLLADPQDLNSVVMVSLVLGALAIPAFMRWYHPWLFFAMNTVTALAFVPGQPPVWMLLAGIGLVVALLNRFTNPEARFVLVPAIIVPLLFLSIVVVVTAVCRGGIGMRILGSAQFGGRYYIFMIGSVLAFFALTSKRIPPERAQVLIAVFFLANLTGVIPALAERSRMEFLDYIFPPASSGLETLPSIIDNSVHRPSGLSYVFSGLSCLLLARYGLRGICDFTRPWRLLALLAALTCGLFCGYRSALTLFGLTLAFQFWFEGLCRPRNLAMAFGVLLACWAVLVPTVNKLPFVVQRTISFLPLSIDHFVQVDAQTSSEWRVRIWQEVIPSIPKYLLLGKGYGFQPGEFDFSRPGMFGGEIGMAISTGDYHSGPLSVIVAFGIWGVIAFVWFLVASVKYLYRVHRNCPPALRCANTFILSYFLAQIVQFFVIYGMLPANLPVFVGLIGLSVSLNGIPVAEEAETAAESEEMALEPDLAPSEFS